MIVLFLSLAVTPAFAAQLQVVRPILATPSVNPRAWTRSRPPFASTTCPALAANARGGLVPRALSTPHSGLRRVLSRYNASVGFILPMISISEYICTFV
jgi:hypothetical protein